MSSTYVHYSAPSSLPSDYAILSRYAASRAPAEEEEDTGAIDGEEDAEDHDHLGVPINSHLTQRRTSFPSEYIRPPNPPAPAVPDEDGTKSTAPTEYTPLLIPRIQEEEDEEVPGSNTGSSLHVFWEEARILLKYTLPVYGYVHIVVLPIYMFSIRCATQDSFT